jgi:hypothetical protein
MNSTTTTDCRQPARYSDDQAINVDNGHGDSEERIPSSADDGASDDGVAQSALSL